MTPKACSLYDWIVLYERKNGYAPLYATVLANYSLKHVNELITNNRAIFDGNTRTVGLIKP